MDVMVFEPSDELRARTCAVLEQAGISVRTTSSAAEARQMCDIESIGVALVDLDHGQLPPLRRCAVPGERGCGTVLGLTADTALDVGHEIDADEVLSKATEPDELIERVRWYLQRPVDRLEVDDLRLDARSRRVEIRGQTVSLSRIEFDLLWHLAANAGRTVTRGELLEAVWRSSASRQRASTVTEHIHRLRTRIERDADHPERIVTVNETGYRLDPSPIASDVPNVAAGAGLTGTAIVLIVGTNIRYANRSARALLASGHDIAGRDVFDFVATESVEAVRQRHSAAAAGGWPRPERVTIVSVDGDHHVVDLASTPVVFDGEPASQVTIWPASDR